MTQTLALNNGQRIPAIGFGTWHISPDDRAKAAVLTALEIGYRLVDTARIYANERGVGQAVAKSGLPREGLFITTKLWNDDQGYDRTLRAFEASLERLGLDYLDLYLIHWPATSRRDDSWQAMTQLQAAGRTKSIGVSNYTIEHLQQLMASSPVVPAVNQVEFHPFIYAQQKPLLDFCRRHHIVVEAYSPLRRLAEEGSDQIETVGQHYGKSAAQVTLRWCLQHGTVPLPRSANPEHIKSNFDIFDFELSQQDMAIINNISDGERVTWDPAGMAI